MPPLPRSRRCLSLAAVLVALAAPPLAAAACEEASQLTSNYRVTYTGGTATEACFKLSVAAGCSPEAPCCLGSGSEVQKLLLIPYGLNQACVSQKNLKSLRVTQDGAQNKVRRANVNGLPAVNTGVKGVFYSDPVFCIDAKAVPGCGTIKDLCGPFCSFRLAARGAAAGSGQRTKCCVRAPTSATPVSKGSFNLVTINVGSNTALDKYFADARDRWQQVLTVDLPDVDPVAYGGPGFEWWPGYKMIVDDVTIFYQLYDFPSNTVLGEAGPRYRRMDALQTPITGLMSFNSKLLNAVNETQWRAVILHEMGHVLGIGVSDYWVSLHGCVPRTCKAGSNATIPYICANAVREFAALPGCGPKLPVETTAILATSSCQHWQEATLDSELMTPSVERGPSVSMPLSRVTLGALEDIYGPGSVDYTKADPWGCTSPATKAAAFKGASPASSPGEEVEFEVTLLEPIPLDAVRPGP